MKKFKKIFYNKIIPVIIFLMIIIPAFAIAAGDPPSQGLVTCKTSTCNFDDLMDLINTVITFILKDLALPIAAIMFVYAGFLMVTAGGEAAHAREKAKSIFTSAVVGLIIAFAAWLIISMILTILGYDGGWIGLKFGV